MERGDFVRVAKRGKPTIYGVLLRLKHVTYDPPRKGVCAEVRGLINDEGGERKWYRMRFVFADDRD